MPGCGSLVGMRDALQPTFLIIGAVLPLSLVAAVAWCLVFSQALPPLYIIPAIAVAWLIWAGVIFGCAVGDHLISSCPPRTGQ